MRGARRAEVCRSHSPLRYGHHAVATAAFPLRNRHVDKLAFCATPGTEPINGYETFSVSHHQESNQDCRIDHIRSHSLLQPKERQLYQFSSSLLAHVTSL